MTEEEFACALKAVDWANVVHCYGPAGNIPDLMLALFEDAGSFKPSPLTPVERLMLAINNPSALPPEPPDPMGDLFNCLFHQGDIYPATATAVPYLIELLRQPRTSRHHKNLLLLLACCLGDWAQGRVWAEQQVLQYGPDFRSKPSYKCMMDMAEWGERAYPAVLEGVPVYLSLVSDQRPEVRGAAAAVLRKCGERSREILPHLQERLGQETEPIPRAGLLLATATLCRESDNTSTYQEYLLREIEDNSTPPVVRLAAIVGYVEAGGTSLPLTARQWLEQFREDAEASEADIFAKTSHAFHELLSQYEKVQADDEGVETAIQRLLSSGFTPLPENHSSG